MTGRGRWTLAAAVGFGLLVAPVSASSETLTLDAALVLAQEASQSLERGRLEIDAARAELTQARASLYPQIGANLGLAYVGNPSEGVTVPPGAFGAFVDPATLQPVLIPDAPVEVFPDQKNLGLSATLEIDQPVFTSGKLAASVNAAVAGVEVGAAKHESSVWELRREVLLAYAAVTGGRESVAIVDDMVGVLAERLADVEQQYAAGATTQGDVLSAQARHASARLQLVRTRQGLETAETNLAWLIGRDRSALGSIEAVELPSELPVETELVERARTAHPMLEELRASADRAAVGVDGAVAASALRPDIGLRVKAELLGQTIPFLEDDWDESWDANLTISIGTSATIFDGRASFGRRDGAEARLAQARSAFTEFNDALPLRIRASVERYLVAQAMLDEARAQLAAAEEDARVARVSFENDVITRSEALGARLGVLQAQLAVIAARMEGARALAEIEYLAGAVR